MKPAYLIAGCAFLVLAGCAEAPTATMPEPTAPSFNGFGFGSGNLTQADSTYEESATALNEAAADGDSIADGRSGFGFGSGH